MHPRPGRSSSVLRRMVVASLAFLLPGVGLADWPQFRGPGALGRGQTAEAPLHWSDTSNIVWKAALPGPGTSSPIVVGNRIFLTCFTGFATSSRERGEMTALKRHLLCLNLTYGKIVWDSAVPSEQPEQERIREDH